MNLPVPNFARNWARGLDISHWNGGVQFTPQNLPDFVLQRVTQADGGGVHRDPSLDRIYQELSQVPVLGGWHFWSGFQSTQQQVDLYLQAIKGKRYKVHALDWEIRNKAGVVINPDTKPSAQQAGEWVRQVAEATKQPVLLYCQSSDFIRLSSFNLPWISQVELWAKYWILRSYLGTARLESIAALFKVPVQRIRFLQYGGDSGDTTGMGDGKLFGVKSASVDVDVYRGTVDQLHSWLKIKPEETPTPAPPSYSTEEKVEKLWEWAQKNGMKID